MRDRVKALCRQKGVALTKVEEDLGFAKGYLSKLGNTTPSGAKLQSIADYFGVSVEYLMTGQEPNAPYYLNDDARELAEFLFRNPEYKVLFDATRKVKKEDIDFVRQMIERTSR